MTRRLLPLTFVIVTALPQLGLAQGGILSTYADPQGIECDVRHEDYGLLFVYVVHTHAAGVMGVTFSAPQPACLVDVEWVTDVSPFTIVSGNSQAGIVVDYGACLTSPIHVVTIYYWSPGLGSPACCRYPIFPHPGSSSGNIEVTDCGGNIVFGSSISNTINGNETCDCTVGIEASTWGAVKALYQ